MLSAFSLQAESDVKPIFGVDSVDFIYVRMYGGLDGFEFIPGAKSRFMLYLGGGYISDSYQRDIYGERVTDPEFVFPGSGFHSIALDSRLGLDLGIQYHNDLKKNWLYSRLYIMTDFQSYITDETDPSTLSQTDFPDNDGYWETSLFTSLQLDLLDIDRSDETIKGISAEAALAWVPGIGMNSVSGDADYLRFDANWSGFIPLLKNKYASLYLGDRVMFDCLFGDKIPAHAQRRMGGFKLEHATGGAVRGIDKDRFDGNLKLINNFDIRMTFPALIHPKIIPEIFAFFDMALVDNLDWVLCSFAEGIYTIGIGIFINSNLFGIALDAGWYVSWDFQEEHFNPLNIKLGVHQF